MTSQIASLIEQYAHAAGLSVTYASRLATGNSSTVKRLQSGGDVTITTYRRITQWLSDRWPMTAVWPAGTPRPPPSPGSPAALAEAEAEAAENDNNEKRYCQLDARSEIADPRAFVAEITGADRVADEALRRKRLNGDMKIYRYVVARYRDGAAGGGPRKHSVAELILQALMDAGDARFAERKRLLDMGREMFRGAA